MNSMQVLALAQDISASEARQAIQVFEARLRELEPQDRAPDCAACEEGKHLPPPPRSIACIRCGEAFKPTFDMRIMCPACHESARRLNTQPDAAFRSTAARVVRSARRTFAFRAGTYMAYLDRDARHKGSLATCNQIVRLVDAMDRRCSPHA